MKYLNYLIFLIFFSYNLCSWVHEIEHIETLCDISCDGGACLYNNCDYPSCNGGACKFINCYKPTCQGGGCIFEECIGAECGGGSCDFINPKETLKTGYCAGDGCTLNGEPHPHLQNHLTY
mmetsp:Transcript_23978/g.24567  ORF Transcript_23978/g.24567 Transcript_23978/m.24567 type:complete len:121 (-) Transcript_23978:32-394(-)